MLSAAGILGRPGIVITLPVYTTTNPAPAETLAEFTLMIKSLGRPFSLGLSVKEAAGVLGASSMSVRTHLSRVRQKLRGRLGEIFPDGPMEDEI